MTKRKRSDLEILIDALPVLKECGVTSVEVGNIAVRFGLVTGKSDHFELLKYWRENGPEKWAKLETAPTGEDVLRDMYEEGAQKVADEIRPPVSRKPGTGTADAAYLEWAAGEVEKHCAAGLVSPDPTEQPEDDTMSQDQDNLTHINRSDTLISEDDNSPKCEDLDLMHDT